MSRPAGGRRPAGCPPVRGHSAHCTVAGRRGMASRRARSARCRAAVVGRAEPARAIPAPGRRFEPAAVSASWPGRGTTLAEKCDRPARPTPRIARRAGDLERATVRRAPATPATRSSPPVAAALDRFAGERPAASDGMPPAVARPREHAPGRRRPRCGYRAAAGAFRDGRWASVHRGGDPGSPWIQSGIAGGDARRPGKPAAFFPVRVVEQDHGRLFPRPASIRWRPRSSPWNRVDRSAGRSSSAWC